MEQEGKRTLDTDNSVVIAGGKGGLREARSSWKKYNKK